MFSRLHLCTEPTKVARLTAALIVTALAVTSLVGCGGAKKDKPSSQTAAKVNKEEITVHQINYVLQQQRGLLPEQAASAGQQVLDRLVDQELAVQKAQEQKLDREVKVMQQIEAARKEIIARSYIEKIASGATEPTAEEIKNYYNTHPALFKERKVYNLQEITVQAKPEQLASLQTKLNDSKDTAEFLAYLKVSNFKFNVNQAVRAAEQLPLEAVDKFAQIKDGQNIFNKSSNGVQIVVVAASRMQPIDESKAGLAIKQFLLNERKRKVVDDDLRALRMAAKIEYVGDYAKGAVVQQTPAGVASEPPPLTSIAPPSNPAVVSIPTAASQVEPESISVTPASAPNSGTLEKGIKGFR
jgi:EpsD family peptidyl-prolyl cis-trans isomerase